MRPLGGQGPPDPTAQAQNEAHAHGYDGLDDVGEFSRESTPLPLRSPTPLPDQPPAPSFAAQAVGSAPPPQTPQLPLGAQGANTADPAVAAALARSTAFIQTLLHIPENSPSPEVITSITSMLQPQIQVDTANA